MIKSILRTFAPASSPIFLKLKRTRFFKETVAAFFFVLALFPDIKQVLLS